SKARVSGFVASNNDERILSCAYRIQNELPPDCPHKIIFVTDDCNLQLKAEAHAMKCMSSEDYCKLMNESRIPEDPEEPMEIDSEPDPIPIAPNTSDVQALQKKDPPQMSRETKSEVRLVSCATQTSLEPVEGSPTETPVQLRNNKNGNQLACWPAVKDENSAAFCDKEENNSDGSRSAHYYIASARDSPTVRLSRSQERSRPQSRLGYYKEQVVGRYDEKSIHGTRRPSRLCPSRDCSPPSDPYIHSSPISSRPYHNSFENVGDQANRYNSYDDKESTLYSHDSRSEDGLYKNEYYAAPPRRSRGRNRRRSGKNDGRYGTASTRVQIANDVPGDATSSRHRSQQSPCAVQKTNSSKDSSQSASELALMEFVDVWSGLVKKVIEKIELGNPSEKAKSDIRKLRDCAQQ
ncbi:PINc domain-containing protein, partial [Trichostrongylus colubriformis]